MSESRLEDWTGRTSDALKQLEAEGYLLTREPRGSSLPPELRGLRPDIIGRRGDDIVVVEVSTRGKAGDAQLKSLAEVVGRNKNWRLLLLWAGEDIPEVPSQDVVGRWLTITQQISAISRDAGLLSVWVAVEAALERLVSRQGIADIRGPASRLIAELYSLGVLSERQHTDLLEGKRIHDIVAHGRDEIVRSAIVERLGSLADWFASESFVSTDQMVEEFLNVYEDPAQGVPYNSSEGGYLYVAGGPFDALDVLSDLYPLAPQPDIDDAVERLENESIEWVRRGDY